MIQMAGNYNSRNILNKNLVNVLTDVLTRIK